MESDEEKVQMAQLLARYRRDCLLDELVLRSDSTTLNENELLEVMGEDGRNAFHAALPKMMSEYVPWFTKSVCLPPPCCTIIHDLPSLSTISKKQSSPLVWFNLVDVLYWYCCLQRKDLGDVPNEIELIDASPVLSGMINSYSSMEDCMEHIANAMAFFFPQKDFRDVLLKCSVNDLKQLLAFGDRVFIALCHLYTVTCRESQKQAHGLRLYYLLVWFHSQSSSSSSAERLSQLAALL